MKKMLFVYNPFSGKGMIKKYLADIIDIFTKAGYEVTAYPTQRALDGYDKVCESDGVYDMIACSGGDGTLNEVISAAVKHIKKRPVIGYIPAGSTNDYAVTLGIPKNMIKAANLAASGTPFGCDLGMMNGRYYNYVAAFGLFTEVSYSTPQNLKNKLGYSAYVLESVKSLHNVKKNHIKIICNDISFEGDYLYGMVTNTRSVAGFKDLVGEDVKLDDGLFEVMLIKSPNSPVELQQIVAGSLSKNAKSPMVDRIKTNHIIFESEEAIPWTVDGENADSHQRVEIEVANKAIDIIADIDAKLEAEQEEYEEIDTQPEDNRTKTDDTLD